MMQFLNLYNVDCYSRAVSFWVVAMEDMKVAKARIS